MTALKTYLPGDEWLYLRIYTGYQTADNLLSDVLFPVWLEAREHNLAATWFFIRYADPDFHLRYRIRMNNGSGSSELLPKINHDLQPWQKTGLVWKLESGTYMRETERYGIDSMAYVEQLFCTDSDTFVKFLNSGLSKTDQDLRWLFALASIDMLLNDFKFSISEKKELLLSLNRSFGREFGKNKFLAKQLSTKYRSQRIRMMNLLSNGSKGTDDRILAFLKERSEQSHDAINSILRLYEEDKMTVEKSDLLASLIHMSMNRLFRNNNRIHEMVIYDLLFRHYKEKTYRNIKPEDGMTV